MKPQYKALMTLHQACKANPVIDDVQANAIIKDSFEFLDAMIGRETICMYKNYRGEIAERRLHAVNIRYAETEYHAKTWILKAYCQRAKAHRDFAILDFIFPELLEARWLPVSDIPRDGRMIDIYLKPTVIHKNGIRLTDFSYDDSSGEFVKEGCEAFSCKIEEISHFMFIPEAPKGQQHDK